MKMVHPFCSCRASSPFNLGGLIGPSLTWAWRKRKGEILHAWRRKQWKDPGLINFLFPPTPTCIQDCGRGIKVFNVNWGNINAKFSGERCRMIGAHFLFGVHVWSIQSWFHPTHQLKWLHPTSEADLIGTSSVIGLMKKEEYENNR